MINYMPSFVHLIFFRKFGDLLANVVLVSFYNQKSIGLKYLEKALAQEGYEVLTVYFKKFNSVNPKEATEAELGLLARFASDLNPIFIGFSVMTSLYLEAVKAASKKLRSELDIPIVMGGVYPSMFCEECLDMADFVIVGEGEEAIVELAFALRTKTSYNSIQNLAFRKDGHVQKNEIRSLLVDIDRYDVSLSATSFGNKYIIEDGKITKTDPHVSHKTMVYELACSRGCPYACSYCCSVNLMRISEGKGPYVRFREVDYVIKELLNAKKHMKNLRFIRFWDEIFTSDDAWLDRFVSRYKKEIGLQFEMWGHPLWVKERTISKLKKAGLYKITMGIQSGSPYIRKEIFHRTESQEDILRASEVLAGCGIPQIVYDFILSHPFETPETILETYALVKKLAPPFELHLHRLNFIPGTDVTKKAIDMNVVSAEDMLAMMNAPMKEQYNKWLKSESKDPSINHIYNLIFLSQFSFYRKKLDGLFELNETNRRLAEKYCARGRMFAKLRHYYHKGMIVFKGIFS